MKKVWCIILSLVLVAGIGFGCAPKEKAKKKAKKETKEKPLLRLGYVTQAGTSNHRDLLVAREKGFFKANGVNVELAGLDATAILPSIMGGRLEGGAAAPISALMAIEKGADLKLVCSGTQWDKPEYLPWIVVAEDSPIKTVEDLDGKTIAAWPKGTCIWAWIKSFELEHGIAFSEYIETLTGSSEMVLSGKADACVAFGPSGLSRYKGKLRPIAPGTANAKIGCCQFFWFRSDFLKEHPEAVKGLMKALQEAHEYIEDNPVEAIQIAVKDTPGADFEYYKTRLEQGELWDYPSEILVEAWQVEEAQKLNLKLGLQHKRLDIKKYVDPRFAKPVWKMPKGAIDWLEDIEIPEY